jgi:hypothetical protein
MGWISKLPPLFELEKSDMWILTDDKVEILTLALDTLIVLISGNNLNTYANQVMTLIPLSSTFFSLR